MRLLRKISKRLTKDWWEVRRTCWPYPEGYATYNPAKKTILDTGLTKEQAEELCKELNSNE
jgi:hypothetical protein